MTDQTQSHALQKQVREKFDLNQVRLSGKVQRMWASPDDADVIIRLSLRSTDDKLNRATLKLPGGSVNGKLVTLMRGDRINVAGYLIDAPYTETGAQFVGKSYKRDLAKDVPGLADIVAERMATYVIVQSLEFEEADCNEVTIEGLVTKTWVKEKHLFVRLAIYDQYAMSDNGRSGKRGHSWRKPHYVSLQFPDGKVDGREVKLNDKDRIRVNGYIRESHYSESLALFLMRNKKIGLLNDVPNADDVRNVRSPRVATYVIVDSMLQFTK